MRRHVREYGGRFDMVPRRETDELAALRKLLAKFAQRFVEVFRDRMIGRVEGTSEIRRIDPDLVRPEALRFDPDKLVLDQGRLVFVDLQIAPATQSLDDLAAAPPGPKPGRTPAADRAWEVAEAILNSSQRPPKGRGRLTRLAELVHARLAENYKVDTVRKMIGPSLRDWEDKNPDK
jgi:hypothetical protein